MLHHKSPIADQPRRLSRAFIIGWLVAFAALFMATLFLHIGFDYQNFKKSHRVLMQGHLETVVRQINNRLDDYHKALELFVVEERAKIAKLAYESDQPTISDAWSELKTSLAMLYPEPFRVLITDINRELKFDSFKFERPGLDLAKEETTTGACGKDATRVEVMATWGHGSQQGIFILCQSLHILAKLIQAGASDAFDILLIDRAKHNVLVHSSQTLSHPMPLLEEDRESLAFNTPIVGGPWRLAVLSNRPFYRQKLQELFLYSGGVFVIFCLLMSLLAYRFIMIESKRVKAERDWHTLQERAQVTLASIADGVIVTDVRRCVEYMNPNAERMTGWVFDDVQGRPLEKICPVPPDVIHNVEQKEWYTSGGPQRSKITIHRASGEVILEQSATPLIRGDDEEPGIVWVLHDVTTAQKVMADLAEREAQYRLLAENVHDVICTLDLKLNLSYVSPSVEGLLGYHVQDLFENEEVRVLNDTNRQKLLDMCHELLDAGKETRRSLRRFIEIEAKHQKGHSIWIELNCSLMRDKFNQPVGILGIARDITERRHSEAELRLSAIVFENSFEGILITDPEGRIVRVNNAFTKVTGYALEEVINKNASILQSGRHSGEFFKDMWQSLESYGYWHGEIWNRRHSGEIYPQRLSISVIRDKQRNILNYIGIFADITEKKQTEERIHRLAYYDELSELPNRVLFQERLRRAMITARRNNVWVGLLFIDLDRFKSINDTMGHPAGDQLLKVTAERLKSCLREEDTVARMGGDEFTLILVSMKPGERAIEGSRKVAEKVLKVISEPYEIGGREVFVGASVGIAFYPKDGTEPTELVKNADMALYHAKAEGRNNYQYYSEDMNSNLVSRLEMEHDLRRAQQANEFKIYYQPQVCVESGNLCGVEALLRWYSPSRGLVSPGTFIPVAEETGLILPIGEWSLREACRQCVEWQRAGYPVPKLAVNLSARQFNQSGLVELVQEVLASTGLAASCLELELTESVLMDDTETTIKTLSAIKAMGVMVSIDDFGTGYSSLNYLKRFPIDNLKIDQTFVRDITVDADDAEVIAAIIAIAHNLKLGVIAEGVETWGQLEFLRFHKCNEVQGYLVSRPLDSDAMTKLLATGDVETLYQKFM